MEWTIGLRLTRFFHKKRATVHESILHIHQFLPIKIIHTIINETVRATSWMKHDVHICRRNTNLNRVVTSGKQLPSSLRRYRGHQQIPLEGGKLAQNRGRVFPLLPKPLKHRDCLGRIVLGDMAQQLGSAPVSGEAEGGIHCIRVYGIPAGAL